MPRSRSVKIAAAIVGIDCWMREKKTKKKRRICIRDWIVSREENGTYSNLLNELRMEDAQQEDIVNMTLNFLYLSQLKGRQLPVLHVVIASDAVVLTIYLMKPYLFVTYFSKNEYIITGCQDVLELRKICFVGYK